MPGKIERSIDELYQDDRERADAVAFGRRTGVDRRGFLGGTGLAAMGVAVGGSIPFAEYMPAGLIPAALIPSAMAQAPAPGAAPKGPQYLNFPGKADKLVVLGERPLVAETPEHLLDDDTTPIDKFFIRNNGQMPEAAKDPDGWKIVVDGEVNQKLELTLAELKAKFRPVTRRLVLECGGNGRSFFATQARGNQWTNGGVGCAEWTGVRLVDVLKAAGVKPSAIFTGNYGADRSLADASKDAISRGVPIKKALDANNLIVFAMDGQPLPHVHGGPVRLIMPGWPGSVSSKWLTRIWLRDKVHDGPGMGGTSYRVAINPMVPGDRADEKNFKDLGIDAGALDHHQPDERHELRQGCARGEAARRRLGRRPDGAPRRHLDRLRGDLDTGPALGAQEPLRLAALDRDGEAAERGLLRDLDTRDRFARRHAAACGGQLESAGLWRQSDAPDRDSHRMMRSRAICALALATLALAAGPVAAQAPAFTPRDESPEDYPAAAGREQAFYACTPCHGFKIVAQQAQTRLQWNDTLDWMTQRHAMPRPSDNDRKVLLDYLEAAFPARAPRGWQNPFQK